MRIIFIAFFCFAFSYINAQETAIKSGLKSRKNMDGTYNAYPDNLSVEKCKKWFSKNEEYVLVEYDSTEVVRYGFEKVLATKIKFIPKAEHVEYLIIDKIFTSLETGSIRNMVATMRQNPNVKLGANSIEKIALGFAKNYPKCADMELHEGKVYTHTVENALMSTKFYRKPTADEVTLRKDMEEFILLCPELKDNAMLKRAALEYVNKTKDGDMLYYYKIFNNYGFLSKQEIDALDNKTYNSANTIKDFNYYLELFPEGLHNKDALSMLNGGLYEKQIKELEKIEKDAMKIIAELKGYGLSSDIIVEKNVVEGLWSYIFGASTTRTLYTSDAKINKMLLAVQNIKSDFQTSDVKNKMSLVDSVLSLIAIIDGLWAGEAMLASSISVLGIWKVPDSWDGYVGSDCGETPKCREVRLKMQHAINAADRLLELSNQEQAQALNRAKERISQNYSKLITTRDNNALLCKIERDESRRRMQAERCAGCAIDFAQTQYPKIVMKNGNKYEYKYSNGKWRVENLLWFDSKYDTYEEMIMSFLEQCQRIECR